MKPKNYEVLMDIYMGVLNAPAIQFTTEDFGMCQITFSLLEDRITPYNLSNCIVRMVINGQQQDCTISDANNGKAEIVLLQSMFTEVGHVFAELQIYDATNQTMRLTTPTFKYTVRKSLMDDNTVQADANYSMLQQMILNVSNADKVSSEALKLSKEAKAICDDLVPKANKAAQNAQEALDRAESVVTQEELAQKVMLGGKDTKFDFIENQVVKDGLIGYFTSDEFNDTSVNLSNGFTYIIKHKKLANWARVMNSTSSQALIEVVDGVKGFSRLYFPLEDEQIVQRLDLNPSGGIAVATCIDGVFRAQANNLLTKQLSKTTNITLIKPLDVLYDAVLIYNRVLTPQEIQQNLSVLNNSPSIKELHTTDAEGKTSILKLASDTDHVTDRSGRTQDEINRTFYKRSCEEFTSTDGSPITVENGEEGYVLSAEIKGKTVKNIVNLPMNNLRKDVSISDCPQLKTNTLYTIAVLVTNNTYTTNISPFITNSSCAFSKRIDFTAGEVGLKIITDTTKSDFTGVTQATLSYGINGTTELTCGVMIFEGDVSQYIAKTNTYIPFGLSSTQAIVSNNGQQYPIYANEEDKANKKVISLGGIGGVYDTLEIKEDGSGVYTKRFMRIDDLLIDKWIIASQGDPSVNRWQLETSFYTLYPAKCTSLNIASNILSSNMMVDSFNLAQTKPNVVYGHAGKVVGVSTEKTISSIEQFKEWFRRQSITYELDVPIVTHIPKELVPVILTHNQTNILDVGGKVKASSFKVTVPVDKLAEIEARLQALESTTVDVVLNK